MAKIGNWGKFDFFSLRSRLTIGIAAVSAVGLGSVAIWTIWQMQQILIDSHKQRIEYIAQRLPRDVELYSEIWSIETALPKAIDNLTTAKTFLWVKHPNGTLRAKSAYTPADHTTAAVLMSFTDMPLKAQVYEVNKRYFVLSSNSLQVKGKALGQLFVAQDISYPQKMFLSVVQSLSFICLLSLLTITVTIAIYIHRSLKPLRQISQLAQTISADDLGQARLQLNHAPTEVRELAQMCDMMLDRLSAAWEQQRQFVSNVSHELRTPLTIVHGYLQSVLRRDNLTPTQREALETAAVEAERTIRLLQDLLELARADTGYIHLHLESFVLNDLVVEVGAMAERYSNRFITIEAVASAIKVKADRNRLKQVLLNLIDNAVKYSEASQPVTLKLEQLGEKVIIKVCDRGFGIPLQYQSRIFDRFYRVDEARTRSTGGYGLGLSIVKTLVDSMGGSVTVRSKLDEGTVFTVTLPAY